MDAAEGMLSDIPDEQKSKIARFLEGQGYKEQALEVATDPEHRFELALGLGQLQIALELARESDVEHKWKTVGDAALTAWDLKLAEESFRNAKDLGSLLLLYSSSADADGLRDLAQKARDAGQHNVAFTALWQTADVDGCLDILLATGRTAEAVLFAQTYKPSRCKGVVEAWKAGLEKAGRGKVSRSLGVPGEDEEMFPEWEASLRLEGEDEGGVDLIDIGNGEANGVEDGGEEEGETEAVEPEAEADEAADEAEASPQTETEV